MTNFLAGIVIVALSMGGTAQLSLSQTTEKGELPPSTPSAASSALPTLPKGKSTVIGGRIRNVDPVRDQFILQVVGGQAITVLFDERTQVYRDGERISLLDIRPDDHGSVETVLDGTKIFAIRIHTLSQLPEGELRGLVLRYDQQTSEVTVNVAASQKPITFRIPAGTPMERVGQAASAGKKGEPSDLVPGSLIDLKFRGGGKGQGVVSHVDIVAVPGSTFVFSGDVSFLDLHAGRFAIVDPQDDKTYQISFEPSRFPITNQLHVGSALRVTTHFDGSRYLASEIAIK
jgi:hypothetical protein